MKYTHILLLTLFALAISACSPNPKIQGKSLSDWISQLSDRDIKTQEEAIEAIKALEPKEAQRSKGALKKLAIDPSTSKRVRGKAAIQYRIFFGSTPQVSPDDVFAVLKYSDVVWRMQAADTLATMIANNQDILPEAVNILQEKSDDIMLMPALMKLITSGGEPSLTLLDQVDTTGNMLLEATVLTIRDDINKGENVEQGAAANP